jgi:hypothetical protein
VNVRRARLLTNIINGLGIRKVFVAFRVRYSFGWTFRRTLKKNLLYLESSPEFFSGPNKYGFRQ